jgi:hypothetical protein
VYKVGVKKEIEEVKAAGEPAIAGLLPSDADADALVWSRWDAATRDSIMLYAGGEVYEKHLDDLTLSDVEAAVAFCQLTVRACLRSGEQHKFVADVKEDLEYLGGNDA